jgi:hypothetical protein
VFRKIISRNYKSIKEGFIKGIEIVLEINPCKWNEIVLEIPWQDEGLFCVP